MKTLTLVPATMEQQVSEIVTVLRTDGFRAMAARNAREGSYAAVIIPPPRGRRGGGQYHVAPVDSGLRVRWCPTDAPAVPVEDVDTAAHAASLILDHQAGLYP